MTRPSKKLSKSLNKGTDGLGNNKLREGAVAAIKQLTEHHNALAKATQEGLNSLEAAITERLNDNSNIPGRVPFPSREQMEVQSMNNAVGAASKLPPTLASIVGR